MSEEAAGLYKITPEKHTDTIYKDVSIEDEILKEIPDPEVAFYLAGDEQ